MVLPKYLDTPFVDGQFLEASFGKLKLWIFCSFFLGIVCFSPALVHKTWPFTSIRVGLSNH